MLDSRALRSTVETGERPSGQKHRDAGNALGAGFEGCLFRQLMGGSNRLVPTHKFQVIPSSLSCAVPAARQGLLNNRQPAFHFRDDQYILNRLSRVHSSRM